MIIYILFSFLSKTFQESTFQLRYVQNYAIVNHVVKRFL